MGARPLRRAIQRYIEDPLADEVLRQGEMVPGLDRDGQRDEAGDEEDKPLKLTIIPPKKPQKPKKTATSPRRSASAPSPRRTSPPRASRAPRGGGDASDRATSCLAQPPGLRFGMPDPGRTAIGTWSGGRFLRFGETIGEERLEALLRPGGGIDTVLSADTYGQGEADRVLGRALAGVPREELQPGRRRRARLLRGRARRPARLSPLHRPAACAAPASTRPTCGWRPSAASSGSAPTPSTCCCSTTPTAPATRSEAVWDGMAALREAGLAAAIGVAPGPANGFTLDLIACLERFGDRHRLGDGDPQPLRALAGGALPRRGRASRRRVITRVVDYGGLFWGDIEPGMELAKGDHRAFRPARLDRGRPREARAGAADRRTGAADADPARLPVEPRPPRGRVRGADPDPGGAPRGLPDRGEAGRTGGAARRAAALRRGRRRDPRDRRQHRLDGAEGRQPRSTRARSGPTAGRSATSSPPSAGAGASSPSATWSPRSLRGPMDRKWWTLAGTCAGLFLLMLDSTVVALALPSIQGRPRRRAEGLQWVMNGYLLAITVCVVTAGRLGDMFGRKRVFLVGMAVFAAGSVVSGAAGDQETLILGRVLQGVGAAPMLPLSLAIVCNAFPREEQARALGIWAGISAVALAIGPFARRRPGRARLAGDLLDQPADRSTRDRDHRLRRARVDRPGLGPPGSTCRAWPLSASASPRWSSPSSRPRPGALDGAGGGRRRVRPRPARLLAHRAPRRRSRSSTSRSSATGPTSAPAPPPSPWSAPTGA